MFKDLTIFSLVLKRDLQVFLQQKNEIYVVILFFVIVVALFPLALGPFGAEQKLLVPTIIWIACLLAMLLAHETMLRLDFQNGVFEQLILSNYSLSLAVLAKILAHWLVTGLPMILLAPILAASFNIPAEAISILFVTLILGTPTLSLVATLGSALTISLPRGGAMLAILILPLYIPILVLASSAGILSLQGLKVHGHLALLAAIAIGASLLAPVGIAKAIRVSIS